MKQGIQNINKEIAQTLCKVAPHNKNVLEVKKAVQTMNQALERDMDWIKLQKDKNFIKKNEGSGNYIV